MLSVTRHLKGNYSKKQHEKRCSTLKMVKETLYHCTTSGRTLAILNDPFLNFYIISSHHQLQIISILISSRVFKETEQDDTLHHQIDRSSSLSDVSNFILNTFTSFSLSLILGIRYLKKICT
jgi:hypothetical protein